MKRVLKSEFSEIYPSLEPYFDTFVKKFPEYDKHRMIADVLKGNSVIWACDKGFIMGRPQQYHNKQNFFLEACCGEDAPSWIDMANVEEDVKAWGFTELEMSGRLGWKKYAANQGYKQHNIILRKEI